MTWLGFGIFWHVRINKTVSLSTRCTVEKASPKTHHWQSWLDKLSKKHLVLGCFGAPWNWCTCQTTVGQVPQGTQMPVLSTDLHHLSMFWHKEAYLAQIQQLPLLSPSAIWSLHRLGGSWRNDSQTPTSWIYPGKENSWENQYFCKQCIEFMNISTIEIMMSDCSSTLLWAPNRLAFQKTAQQLMRCSSSQES